MNLKALYSRNLGLKLVSLVIASLLWLYVELGSDGNSHVSVPVTISNLAPGLSLQGEIPAKVEMDLRGSRIDLMKINSADLRILLDMSGVKEGVVTFDSLDKAVRLGRGVRTTRVYPSAIELKVARKQ